MGQVDVLLNLGARREWSPRVCACTTHVDDAIPRQRRVRPSRSLASGIPPLELVRTLRRGFGAAQFSKMDKGRG